MNKFPQSLGAAFGERFVQVCVKIKTWCIVEDYIDFDTVTNKFIIPNGYQVDAKVIAWKYADDKRNTKEIIDNYNKGGKR